jgi:hypothetical protein
MVNFPNMLPGILVDLFSQKAASPGHSAFEKVDASAHRPNFENLLDAAARPRQAGEKQGASGSGNLRGNAFEPLENAPPPRRLEDILESRQQKALCSLSESG